MCMYVDVYLHGCVWLSLSLYACVRGEGKGVRACASKRCVVSSVAKRRSASLSAASHAASISRTRCSAVGPTAFGTGTGTEAGTGTGSIAAALATGTGTGTGAGSGGAEMTSVKWPPLSVHEAQRASGERGGGGGMCPHMHAQSAKRQQTSPFSRG
jgi:hypothetical protein